MPDILGTASSHPFLGKTGHSTNLLVPVLIYLEVGTEPVSEQFNWPIGQASEELNHKPTDLSAFILAPATDP